MGKQCLVHAFINIHLVHDLMLFEPLQFMFKHFLGKIVDSF